MVSIKDVARAAGVSVSTVSHVVNKTRHVSPGATRAVEDAVRALGYQPSYLARALKSKRTRTLGMLVTSSTNPFFAELVCGVEEACFQAGYSLILCNAGDQPGRQAAYLQTLMQKRIDGLVVMTIFRDADFQDALSRLTALPRAVLDPEPTPRACTVSDDSRAGGRLAGEAIVARGHVRVGCLTGPVQHRRSQDRLRGFREAMEAAGHGLDPDLIRTGDLSLGGGYDGTVALLDNAAPPTAVFAFNDLMAMGAYRAVQERGLRIPDDISIVGYDDIELVSFLTPSLTTIHQPGIGLGLAAAGALIGHLERGEALPERILKQPELVLRDSLGAAPKGAPRCR
ncbi:substrate-binding domain-containing protein [Tropicimonas sp. IMCC6043]|uniref:substrate-binding domain-containing protein n=1 Tax=Tropicimonas sp. IMCC6043 TaxID=2510645 RepID=UPI00101D28E5|nr:substrate-binding domain-containing protein [Tropicimonas sp. IMCC6043]RYH08646.1 LacI family DNA-binding transcriptional regulator [Tropicimonas sp. IMCC6043]